MREMTLEQLDQLLSKMKDAQPRMDSECHLDSEEFCSYCRYVNGYWGDLKVRMELVEDE